METESDAMPMFGTAADVNKYIRRVHPVTLRRALKRGDIKGKLHGTKIFNDLRTVVSWMAGDDPILSPERPPRQNGQEAGHGRTGRWRHE
jgi:hypothetical protein